MKLFELDYDFPNHLIALEPEYPSRVLLSEKLGQFSEIHFSNLKDKVDKKDLIVVNNTHVEKRRLFIEDLEILCVNPLDETLMLWNVLCSSRKWKTGCILEHGGVKFELLERGYPQVIKTSAPLTKSFFMKNGDIPIPPYIQKLRNQRKSLESDEIWYQTSWSKFSGSSAAPTASLHFKRKDLEALGSVCQGVEEVTLHVGFGTYLPIKTLESHAMHSEEVSISYKTWENIQNVKASGGKIWAMGTTTVRALESQAQNFLPLRNNFYKGTSGLFIKPGYKFLVVDRIMTNFHQPKSTLLAMIMAFAGKKRVMEVYAWAIKNKFRLFSYGDLTVWKI